MHDLGLARGIMQSGIGHGESVPFVPQVSLGGTKCIPIHFADPRFVTGVDCINVSRVFVGHVVKPDILGVLEP